jgi:S-methylmethionine-dependent homocysteine/selenocysteine methylase
VNGFVEALRAAPAMLADGGIETRLIYEYGLDLPDFASFLPLFDAAGREAIESLYRSYLDVAAHSGLAMQIGTPTWRAHPDGLRRQGLVAHDDLHRVNAEAVGMLRALRAAAGLNDRVFIAGVIGPRRDGYDPRGAPRAAEARDYHAAQAEILAVLGVDLLYAPTFASIEELLGVAQAMAETAVPYVVAPVLDLHGRLPDGTSLDAAVTRVDAETTRPPLHYMIGCVHPTHFPTSVPQHRVAGLKANASTLPPDQLDRLDHLDAGAPALFGEQMLALRREYGLKVLGGCCGTDARHIDAIARQLSAD